MTRVTGQRDLNILSEPKPGAMVYSAGIWDKNTTYIGTNKARPAVEHDGMYYILDIIGESKGVNPKDDVSGSSRHWIVAESMSNIFTDIILANFGKVGGAVFYGDYMFSQYGINTKTNLEDNNYQDFPGGFEPHIMLDLLKGKSVLNNAKVKGVIDAKSGFIGGFEIANGRIGSEANPNDPSGGYLSIYKDFFRIGNKDTYTMLGGNVIPSTAGGAFTATGRIVNSMRNYSGIPGMPNRNIGLFIDVEGADRNFAISTKNSIVAGSFVNQRIGEITIKRGSYYEMEIESFDTFIYKGSRLNESLNLPDTSDVCYRFGYKSLPSDFGYKFTIKHIGDSGKLIINDVLDFNNSKRNYTLSGGDVLEILAISSVGKVEYHALRFNN